MRMDFLVGTAPGEEPKLRNPAAAAKFFRHGPMQPRRHDVRLFVKAERGVMAVHAPGLPAGPD